MREDFYQIRGNMIFFLRRDLSYVCLFSISFFLLVSFGGRSASAGPWTIQKGGLFIDYSTVWTKSNEIKLYNGTKKNIGNVRFVSNMVFIEYGVLDDLNIYTMLPYESSSWEKDAASTTQDFGDGRFGVKYRFLEEDYNVPVSLALGLEFKIPLSNYPANKITSLGDQQDDYELRLLLGRYFDIIGLDSYVDLEGGYRFRSGDTPNETFWSADLGMFFLDKVSVRVFVDAVEAQGGLGLNSPEFIAITAESGTSPFPDIGEDYVKIGFGLTLYSNDFFDVGGSWSTTTSTANTSLDRHIGINIGYRYF